LTQDEIDALLELVGAERGAPGEAVHDAGAVRAFAAAEGPVKRDFSKPDPIPKDDFLWFQAEAAHAATRVAEGISKWLQLDARVECAAIELQQYRAFLRGLQNHCLVYPLQNGDECQGALSLDPALALAAVDRVLGGAGRSRFASRTLTSVELPIGLALAKKIAGALAEGLSDIVAVPREAPAAPALHVRQARFIAPDVKCVVLTYCVTGDLVETEVRLVCPAHLFAKAGSKDRSHGPAAIPPELVKIGVEVGVRLSETDLTIGEILALEPGDVVPLDGDAGSSVRVEVEGRPVAKGSLGRVHENFAVAIEEILAHPTNLGEPHGA
jgi:flagellar motor switch protein FliM